MTCNNPDVITLVEGFHKLINLPGLPTFSVESEFGEVLFVLCDWKTDNPSIAVYHKNLGNRRFIIIQDSVVFDSAAELATFCPIFKDWVTHMEAIAKEKKEKLANYLDNIKAPPGFRAAFEESKNNGAPPGWHVPAPHGSLARDKQDWEQAQARKNITFEVEAVRKNDV